MSITSELAVNELTFDDLDPNTRMLIERVQTTKCPVVITRQGEAAAVLIEAGEYELQLRRLALLERVARAERELGDGQTHSQEEVEALLDNWLSDRK